MATLQPQLGEVKQPPFPSPSTPVHARAGTLGGCRGGCAPAHVPADTRLRAKGARR